MRPQLSSGEHIVLHLFVKAVRLNGSVLVRGVGWAESADRVHYHALHLEFLRQPGDIVRDALQRKFLYLRETGKDAREHEFRVEARFRPYSRPSTSIQYLSGVPVCLRRAQRCGWHEPGIDASMRRVSNSPVLFALCGGNVDGGLS